MAKTLVKHNGSLLKLASGDLAVADGNPCDCCGSPVCEEFPDLSAYEYSVAVSGWVSEDSEVPYPPPASQTAYCYHCENLNATYVIPQVGSGSGIVEFEWFPIPQENTSVTWDGTPPPPDPGDYAGCVARSGVFPFANSPIFFMERVKLTIETSDIDGPGPCDIDFEVRLGVASPIGELVATFQGSSTLAAGELLDPETDTPATFTLVSSDSALADYCGLAGLAVTVTAIAP